MGNVNILEKRMIKYEVSVKQTAKFIMMLLILSLAYVMPAATTKKIQQVSTVPKKTLTVLLDAGHGADDSGKVGINQVFEKDINLEIAKYVKEFLEKIVEENVPLNSLYNLHTMEESIEILTAIYL